MVSVIVPVYNMEKYLHRCVDSILAQTYKDFELILVDDGSKDSSPEICDDYAQKDARIRVVHKKNGGLSDARNHGMDAAKGEYITFIDSDDWIRPDTLELLVSAVEKYDAQVSVGKFLLVYEDGDQPDMTPKPAQTESLDGKDALKELLYGRLYGTTACGFLIETALAKKFLFPVGKYHEDDYTTFNYYLHSTTVAVTDADLYYYFQRCGSIMHCEKIEVVTDQLDAADHIEEECGKEGEEIYKAACLKRFSSYCQVLSDHPELKKINPDVFGRLLNGIKEEAAIVKNDKNAGKKMRIYAFCYIIGKAPLLRMVSRIKK